MTASARAGRALQTLTPREREVVALVATGQTSSSVAAALGINHTTVKRHLANVYRKLDVTNRVQAANVYNYGHPNGRTNGGRRD